MNKLTGTERLKELDEIVLKELNEAVEAQERRVLESTKNLERQAQGASARTNTGDPFVTNETGIRDAFEKWVSSLKFFDIASAAYKNYKAEIAKHDSRRKFPATGDRSEEK